MASFLTAEQQALAEEVGALLVERGENVCVADGTTGGLVSAALLSLPGASRFFAGGAVLYTIKSRVTLAGAPAELFANYQGTTLEMMAVTANAMRERLGTTWCVAESGVAGPTGGRSGKPPGSTNICIVGPVARSEAIETGLSDRAENMVAFATHTLRLFRDALRKAPKSAPTVQT
jgi:PncC family amidohydrolase